MPRIEASKVLYIKLGQKGEWEKECIEERNILKLGFIEANHEDCIKGNWEKIKEFYIKAGDSKGVAARKTNQIRFFYESDNTVLWITFHSHKLWWCHSEKNIKLEDDRKIRSVVGRWSDKDIKEENIFRFDSISGKLLQLQGFRGTICEISDVGYVLSKINKEELQEVSAVKESLIDLNQKLSFLIKQLHPKDFEILVDLIFRHGGWQRVSTVGEIEKTIDLALILPITGERCFVQIKSKSDIHELNKYIQEFKSMGNDLKFFYVVHSPDNSLKNQFIQEGKIHLLLLDDITKLAINAGLIDWIIKKTS